MKARLPKGMGGGDGGSMGAMIKKAQKMQAEMTKIQDNLNVEEFTASSGGGAVQVVATGNKKIKMLKINEDVVDKDDIEMLEDLVKAAINQVFEVIDTESDKRINSVAGGVSIPGLM
jgi:DNA-binding YbaB/EbfC family protein